MFRRWCRRWISDEFESSCVLIEAAVDFCLFVMWRLRSRVADSIELLRIGRYVNVANLLLVFLWEPVLTCLQCREVILVELNSQSFNKATRAAGLSAPARLTALCEAAIILIIVCSRTLF